jgi:hypothetical protein
MRVRKPAPQSGYGRRREHHIANLTQTNKEDTVDIQGSIVASSTNMTGMSSLIG